MIRIIALVLALVLILSYWVVKSPSDSSGYLSYQIENSLEHVTLDDIDETMLPYLSQSFWDVDLMGLQSALESIEWVSEASITRRWPSSLKISITEHVPVARWGDHQLLSQDAVVFTPQSQQGFESLVQLNADPVQAKLLLAALNRFQAQLDLLDWRLIALSQQVDGVFRVQLDSGIELIVDDSNWEQRLQRFVLAYPKLQTQWVETAIRYDLRYSNGLAIQLIGS